MIAFTLSLVVAVIGGTAAFWLAMFRDRVRLRLNLISVTKGRNPEETAKVGDRIIEISESFRPSPLDLSKEARDSDIQTLLGHARNVQEEAPGQIQFAREMKRRLWHCSSVDEKVDFLADLMNDGKLVVREIYLGMQRCDLSLPMTSRSSHGSSAICEVETGSADGVDSIFLVFRGSRHSFPIGSPSLKGRIQPLAEAIQSFNQEHLDRCLKYAIKAIKDDQANADILMNGLGEIASSAPFRVALMVVNKGKQAAVLNPYAVLQATGSVSSLDPLVLRIEAIMDSRNQKIDVQGPSYVSIEPSATVTLILRSKPIEADEPLAAAYDKGILNCSISLVRLTDPRYVRKFRPKLEETVYKDFGANFDETMQGMVKGRAKGKRSTARLTF